jgi:hypothetical protein
MSTKYYLKEAVVLLFAALMVFSSVSVCANTVTSGSQASTTNIKNGTPVTSPVNRGIVWDNVVGVHGSFGGIIVATVRAEGAAFPADDFRLDTEREVQSVFWQGGYFQCQLATGQHDYNFDWRVIFWNDGGNKPGSEIYNQTIADSLITRSWWYNYTHSNGNTYWVANYSVDLPVSITFDADTTYWITIQAIQGTNAAPQGAWSRHNDSVGGIKLHEAMIKAIWWSYPEWTNISVLVTDKLPHDLNFQLLGPGGDVTPPATTIDLDGDLSGDVYTSDVTVSLTATDAESGVNYTKYKVDDGTWTDYADPFVVAGNGEHVVTYYSADVAGNVEDEKTETFTIQYAIEITISGGFGVKAAIKNTGTVNLTNVSWSITLDGKLIFVGKSQSDVIDSIAVGETVTVKDFVIGFGKTGIAVEAGTASATASGTAFLFFVFGVA